MSTDREFTDAQIMGAITTAFADRNVEMAVALIRVLALQNPVEAELLKDSILALDAESRGL